MAKTKKGAAPEEQQRGTLAGLYRPQVLGDLLGQDTLVEILERAIKARNIQPVYLLTGRRGTGKTSTARILARSLNCLQSDGPTVEPCGVCELCVRAGTGDHPDIQEINAGLEGGVERFRQLLEEVHLRPIAGRFKVYLVDECHLISAAAWGSLLKTLEEPPAGVVFVLATTELHKVPATIVSRAVHLATQPVPQEELVELLSLIGDAEGIAVEPAGLEEIARQSEGCVRDALTFLGLFVGLQQPADLALVRRSLNRINEDDLLALLEQLMARNPLGLLQAFRALSQCKQAVDQLLPSFAELLHDAYVIALVGAEAAGPHVVCSAATAERLATMASGIALETLSGWFEDITAVQRQQSALLRDELLLTMALVRMAHKDYSLVPAAAAGAPAAAAPQVQVGRDLSEEKAVLAALEAAGMSVEAPAVVEVDGINWPAVLDAVQGTMARKAAEQTKPVSLSGDGALVVSCSRSAQRFAAQIETAIRSSHPAVTAVSFAGG